jgi:hypothetical protein
MQSREIDMNKTCVLLVSQSGQTFPTLHATRLLSKYLSKNLWIITGCANSKMESILVKEGYLDKNIEYKNDRIFLNGSGLLPAESSSVAVAATWHTMTLIIINLI